MKDMPMHMNPAMQECIDNCTQCHRVCLAVVQSCLVQGAEHANPSHIRTLLDCAEICQTSANFMMRNSDLHAWTCEVCAEACERCAESCAVFTTDDEMRHCTDVCRQCAASCREMSKGQEDMMGRFRSPDPALERTPRGENL